MTAPRECRRAVLSARGLVKAHRVGAAVQTVLDRVSLDLYDGDFTVVMGPSGAGKSTLLHVLAGMDRADSGIVEFDGERIDSRGEKDMARLRRGAFGFVFQQSRLASNLTLRENVEIAGYLNASRTARETRERVAALLDRMNVGAARDRLPGRVSGGEAQRASIARAVVNEPAVLFADEPTGSLNRANSREVLDLFTDLNREGQGILMVTHDQRAALRGNRILYLVDGRIVGDLALAPYGSDDLAAREARVGQWLSRMDW